MTLPAQLRAIADRSDGMWRDPDVDERWTGIDLPMRYVHGSFGPIAGCDPGIAGWVNLLRFHGIETVQSCEGGPGHAYPEPTIDFLGDPHEGHYVVSLALRVGTFDRLRPWRLSRTWHLSTGEPDELIWQLVLRSAMRDGSSIEPDSASAPEADGAGAAGGGGTSTAPSAPIDAGAVRVARTPAHHAGGAGSTPAPRSTPAFDPLGSGRRTCPECGLDFKPAGLAPHRAKKHGVAGHGRLRPGGALATSTTCPECGKTTATAAGLATHRSRLHGVKLGRRSPAQSLADRKRPANNGDSRPYSFPIGKAAIPPEPVIRHGRETYLCTRCTDRFPTREQLTAHLQKGHPPVGAGPTRPFGEQPVLEHLAKGVEL